MSALSASVLRQLGRGETIAAACASAGIARDQFYDLWRAEAAARTPHVTGSQRCAGAQPGAQTISQELEIVRDDCGIPHIFAASDEDLFFGFGWAMAQDRLWQLDYLRRKALGRLAEILGESGLATDVVARTVGLNRIAVAELAQLPPTTLRLLEYFASGINAAMPTERERLPIEFALLDYVPEPWSPLDSVAIWAEFRWYLTGRLPIIAVPEIVRRHLDNDLLFQAFLTPESGDESILPAGSYPTGAPVGTSFAGAPVGATIGDPDDGKGSNNWTVAGSRSVTGSPLLASDPHIAFGTLSCWYEVHLSGGTFNSVGMAYVGVPFVCMGRNTDVAWGLTNNICSQRDLYLEETSADYPAHFRFGDAWEPERSLTEIIEVRDQAPVQKTIRFSRNGPLVNELLPRALSKDGAESGPISLRWMGATFCDELSTMLDANRAKSGDEFRRALAGWRVPTWNFVFADRTGHIGYQAVGHLPIRTGWTRGFRKGWEPADQWQGVIPFEGMPALHDPECGWIRTANNRNAPEDFPYPLSGTWASGHRAERIREMLEEQPLFGVNDFQRMHYDVRLQRAAVAVPLLLAFLDRDQAGRRDDSVAYLRDWDFRMEEGSVAAAVFELFFRHWSRHVAKARFGAELVPLVEGMIGGLALQLLSEDVAGWFGSPERADAERGDAILAAFDDALRELEERLGPLVEEWQWGRLHMITLRHPLTHPGGLAQLLDRISYPVGGNGYTVCNTGYNIMSDNYDAASGANYRLIADLSNDPPGLWAVHSAGASGNLGSINYCDQIDDWLLGDYHFLPLERAHLKGIATQRLMPARGQR